MISSPEGNLLCNTSSRRVYMNLNRHFQIQLQFLYNEMTGIRISRNACFVQKSRCNVQKCLFLKVLTSNFNFRIRTGNSKNGRKKRIKMEKWMLLFLDKRTSFSTQHKDSYRHDNSHALGTADNVYAETSRYVQKRPVYFKLLCVRACARTDCALSCVC